MKTIMLLSLLGVIALCGCTSTRINGGHTVYESPSGIKIIQHQPQDPKDPSELEIEYYSTLEFIAPAGSQLQNGSTKVVLSRDASVRLVTREQTRAKTGGSYKNMLAIVAEKLKSLTWVTFVGVGIFLFGLCSLWFAPLKALVRGYSVVIMLSGAGLTVLPVLVVGYEPWILSAIAIAFVAWIVIRRHGKKSPKLRVVAAPQKLDSDEQAKAS